MNPVIFLKKLIIASLKRMMKGVEKEMRAEGKVSVVLVTTAVFIMKEMKMVKGLKLFELLLHGLFAEKGMSMPAEIVKIFAAVSAMPATLPAATPAKPVTTQKAAPASIAAAPAQRIVQATLPARELTKKPPPQSAAPGTSEFALRLNGAAQTVGLEDHTPLGRLRTLLKATGYQKPHYWQELRDLLETCLMEKLIKDASTWKALVAKAKENLFFGGRKGEMFIAQCPKELVADLLLSRDGLSNLIDEIRREERPDPSSPYRVAFLIDACVVVGKEAKGLLINCKHAVNRMKQKGFIPENHWLICKVSAMAPAKASTRPTTIEPPSEATQDHRLDNIQQVVEENTVTIQ